MTIPTNIGITKYFRDREELRRNWGWYLLLGILLMLLGIAAISSSSIVTLISMKILGALLLVAGIMQVIYAFWIRKWSGFFLSLLAGILYAVTGFIMLAHPLASALSLTLLLAAFYMVSGIFRIVGSLMTRFEHWGWSLLSGLVALVLGILIWLGWPETGLWVFGLFIGIDLLFFGWFWVLVALTARNTPPVV